MVDIFIFILFSFFPILHSFFVEFIFCWLWMSSYLILFNSKFSPRMKTFFSFLPELKLFRVSQSQLQGEGSRGVHVISHCHFFLFIFTNPTSLICFSSLPIPFDNSHIGYLFSSARVSDCVGMTWEHLLFNLPHHLTNSCFSFDLFSYSFAWIASFLSISILRWILIPPPQIFPSSSESPSKLFLSFM